MFWSSSRLRRRLPLAVAISFAALLAVTTWPAVQVSGRNPDFSEFCEENPYLATVCYRRMSSAAVAAREPAVVAFRDTPNNTPHYVLATNGQVGSVYGLAYSAQENALYAAAYHKRQVPFGSGGPGAIYRIDLKTEEVEPIVTVPNAGGDLHNPRYNSEDLEAGSYAGKTSLGDIDVHADGTELVVVNLADRRLYRYALPDGRLLGSFAHGGEGEDWASDARPFGVAYHRGELYHAVVRTGESTSEMSELEAYVYASDGDGSRMRQIAVTTLDFPRGEIRPVVNEPSRRSAVRWLTWTDEPKNQQGWRVPVGPQYFVSPMPMASDIVFGPSDELILGLRDRLIDMAPVHMGQIVGRYEYAVGAGDTVLGEKMTDTWRIDTSRERMQDGTELSDEATLGGLARLDGQGSVVASAWGVDAPPGAYQEATGAFWFEIAGGSKVSFEGVCQSYGPQPRLALGGVQKVAAHCPPLALAGSIGDIEYLCGQDVVPTQTPIPTVTPSATPTERQTASPSPRSTATATPSPTWAPTATAAPRPEPLFLPIALRERCNPEYQRSDIALVIDTSSSMTGQKINDARGAALGFVSMIDLAPGRSQVTVVRYDREAEVVHELSRARAPLDAAIRGLHVRSGTHIDKGLRTALAELQSARRVERNTPVLVLLTDGVQTGTPGEELTAAEDVRDAGIRLYAVGLGADADANALRAMAGTNERYYFAPDSADLARIYSEIATDLMCPGMWGRR